MKNRIVLSVILIFVIALSCFAFISCEEKPTVFVRLNYQITTQFHSGYNITKGNLLTKPSDPTFVNHTFNDGVGGLNGKWADFELPIEYPRMGEGFDVNKNYLFIGWFKEPECIRPWIFSEDRVYVDTELYAKWIEMPN